MPLPIYEANLVEYLGRVLSIATEGRRRVKEQLKKMGSYEYYHTSFSYQDCQNPSASHRFAHETIWHKNKTHSGGRGEWERYHSVVLSH